MQTLLDLGLTALHDFLFFLQVVDLLIEIFFLLLQTVFLPLHLAATLLYLAFRFVLHAIDLVFCLYQRLFFLALGGLNGIADQPLGFLFGRTKLSFGDYHSTLNASKKGDNHK